jgi:DNA-binding NarL/FixJ family response regulator
MTSSKRVAQRCAGRNILTPGRRPPLIRDLLDGAHDDLTSLREDPLTPRPTEIVKLIAESYSTRQIAETLVISDSREGRDARTG